MEPDFVIAWSFTPVDYFESNVEVPTSFGIVRISEGRAELNVPSDGPTAVTEVALAAHNELQAAFRGARVISHRPYSLLNPSVSQTHEDGRRGAWAFGELPVVSVIACRGDAVGRNEAGEVISDSRAERISDRAHMAELAARHANDVMAQKLLQSYAAAADDPANELVHLFEIVDALERRYGSRKKAASILKLTRDELGLLGNLCNAPLKQGRHRGVTLQGLRDATTDELSAAREAARRAIEAYLRTL